MLGYRLRGLCLIAIALSLLFVSPRVSRSQNPGKEQIGVIDFEALNASKAEAVALSDRLREELLNTGRITLVDRSQISAALDEQALQQTGCTSQECAIKVGKVLGVKKLITGRVVKIGDNLWQTSAILVDVESLETLAIASVTVPGSYVDLLDQSGPKIAARFFPKHSVSALVSVTSLSSAAPPKVTPDSTPRSIQAPLASAPAAPNPSVLPVHGPKQGKLEIALFPVVTTGFFLQAGTPMLDGISKVFQETDNFHIAYTALPEDTTGRALPNIKEISAHSRSGTFVKTVDVEYVRNKGKELGVDAVVLIDNAGGEPSPVRMQIVDVRDGAVYQGRANLTGDYRRRTTQVVTFLTESLNSYYSGKLK